MPNYKNPIAEYSFAICPPEEIVKEVKKMKEELFKLTGWFSSKNAEAHFTFNMFNASPEKLEDWKDRIKVYCSRQQTFEIHLTHTDFFRNGAFFLAPDDAGKEKLQSIMLDFFKTVQGSVPKSSEPHMSIGRRLNSLQLDTAKQLWNNKTFALHFTVDNLALRKFNLQKQQYEVEMRFGFGKV